MTNSGKYVDLLTDAGFKAVFGDPANKIIVKDFLNRMLQGERVIEDFEYMNVEQVADLPLVGKSVRYDLCCRDAAGAQFIIEMQRCSHDEDFFERSVFYGSLLYSRQLRRSDRKYKSPPTYVVGIMEGRLRHEGLQDERDIISRYEFAKLSRQMAGPKTIILIFVELGLFDKEPGQCDQVLDQWLYSLKHSNALEEPFVNDEIERLMKASEIAGFDEKKRLNYDQEMMTLYDYEHDMRCSREEGLAEGRAEEQAKSRAEKLEIAKKCLAMGLTVEQVAEATHITVEELKTLK